MKVKLLAFVAAGMIAAFAGPSHEAAAQPAAGGACSLSLRAEVDGESFDMLDVASGAARDRLVQQTGANFAAAASRLCASRVVTAANLRPYNKLLVRAGAAATEPNVYDDAEEQPGALIVEFAFSTTAPTQAQIEHGLRCWRNPQAQGCTVEDVGP